MRQKEIMDRHSDGREARQKRGVVRESKPESGCHPIPPSLSVLAGLKRNGEGSTCCHLACHSLPPIDAEHHTGVALNLA